MSAERATASTTPATEASSADARSTMASSPAAAVLSAWRYGRFVVIASQS